MSESRPRILVFAYNEVGYACLSELLDRGANVVGVFTYRDDPAEEIWFSSVERLALESDLDVFTPPDVDDSARRIIRDLAPDLILSFYYRSMLPKDILEIPRLGAFNMHGSLLPKYRGRACINWAVLRGETETGATLHKMVERADAGNIVDQEAVDIAFGDTSQDVSYKVADAARRIVARNLDLLEAGTAPLTPQDESLATSFGRRRPEDGRIDWNRSAVELYNLVRAVTHPYPGAFTTLHGERIFVWKALPHSESWRDLPGSVVSLSPLRVVTGNGILEIVRLQPEGEEEIDGAIFAEYNLTHDSRFGQ